MVIKLLLLAAILIQTVATVFAVRLIRTTKYNSIWILFTVGFTLLSLERVAQFALAAGRTLPNELFVWGGLLISLSLSIGVIYAHRLFRYIARLNRQRSLLNKRILSAVLRTEERSRSRFSKELHDGLGPLLSSAKMSLSAIDEGALPAQQREILANTSYVISEAIRSLREISNNLSPHILSDFGLARGIRNFADKSAEIARTPIHFTTALTTERFDADAEVILYRVVCELVNNSLKHAAASRIDVALARMAGELVLEYSDDGRGFDPEAVTDCGMGLSNIASRVNSLGGTFSLTSEPGRGMHASVKVPV